jgi:putative addiction module component (TIGR02574 family)
MSPPSDSARRILEEALELPEAERANVAAELLASLPSDELDGDEAWLAELERRAEAFRRGEVEGTPWDQVERSTRAELRSK